MFKISEIAEIVGGDLIRKSNSNPEIKDILVDSRRLISPEHCIFFALTGRNKNGHDYIPELYNKGIRSFVVSTNNLDLDEYNGANFIRVKNTLLALQALSAAHRQEIRHPGDRHHRQQWQNHY